MYLRGTFYQERNSEEKCSSEKGNVHEGKIFYDNLQVPDVLVLRTRKLKGAKRRLLTVTVQS